MNENEVIKGLSGNKSVFNGILSGLEKEMYLWRPQPGSWCLLEIVCHLLDEEREDFRARVAQVLDSPAQALAPIDPQGWISARNYVQQNYEETLSNFLFEREQSVAWLKQLDQAKWDNAYMHPKFGDMTARMFLTNWLAHDYLHLRQILKLKYDYLMQMTGEDLNYAGNW